ncbi:MAG: hypothetical protein ABIM54_00935 [candidate division WOR-3 bacterium]
MKQKFEEKFKTKLQYLTQTYTENEVEGTIDYLEFADRDEYFAEFFKKFLCWDGKDDLLVEVRAKRGGISIKRI